MPQLSKVKLVEALKKRKEDVQKIAEKRQKQYEAAKVKYKESALKKVESLISDLKKSETPKETYRIAERFRLSNYPSPPRKQTTSSIDKALVELELLDDCVVTVESNKAYLSILSGDEDYDYNPDADAEYDDED